MRKVLAVIPGSAVTNTFIFAKRQVEQMINSGVKVEVCYLDFSNGIRGLIKFVLEYRSKIHKFKPDVIHVHYGTITAFMASFFTLKPVIITFRGSDINPNSDGNIVKVSLAHLLSQISALRAKHIICVSLEMSRRLWCRKDKISIIPSGVDITEFIPVEKIDARTSLNLDLEKKLVLFNLGKTGIRNKRFDLALEAIQMLNFDFNVEIVVMKGDIAPENVYLYLNAVDVLLLTSNFEGSPTIIQEALACNTPICTVNVGDVEFLLEGVSNSFIVDRDPILISKHLIMILAKGERSNGRQFAYRYSAQENLQKILKIINS